MQTDRRRERHRETDRKKERDGETDKETETSRNWLMQL